MLGVLKGFPHLQRVFLLISDKGKARRPCHKMGTECEACTVSLWDGARLWKAPKRGGTSAEQYSKMTKVLGFRSCLHCLLAMGP